MALESEIESDCACLHGLIGEILGAAPNTRSLRDPTRGGIATVLNEIASSSGVSIEIDEMLTPVRDEVKAFCEILGLDPLYLANEGKLVAVTPPEEADAALEAMKAHPLGQGARLIGHVRGGEAGRVTMRTGFGGNRIVDMLVGEQLPRIC
jgi:hydrogenase expression/formation protein HypE